MTLHWPGWLHLKFDFFVHCGFFWITLDFFKILHYYLSRCFPDGSAVKSPHAMQEIWETQVQPLGREDPLEEEMATHSWRCQEPPFLG